VSGPAGGGERQVPFYCPYCGEEALRPADAAGGRWECADCSRGFELRFTGLVAPRWSLPS
jgi:transposase-like protein